MFDQRSTESLLTPLIGGVLFLLLMAGMIIGYAPPLTLPSAAAPVVVTLTPYQTMQHVPTTTSSPQLSPDPSPTFTPRPTFTKLAASPTPTTEPTAPVFEPQDHYWFERPIAASGVNYVSRFYPYGSTYRGRYQVHHGVEFENPTGTPILAAGPGQVIAAGLDDLQVYGRFPNFYGQLVVIQHDRTFYGQPVFTLYGHMSKVRAEVGQTVETGQIIGEVGESGIALGPHLHMEVRVSQNSYDATRNPELWIRPFEGHGTIAGRLLDADGNNIRGAIVTLYDSQNTWRSETETYGEGVNPDEGWQENFVFGSVPAGHYAVQYVLDDKVYTETVEVETGKTARVTLQLTPEKPGVKENIPHDSKTRHGPPRAACCTTQ